jgi:adenosylcobinamide kinase/adenosylcobinamide-phosphate guanylyltransferase
MPHPSMAHSTSKEDSRLIDDFFSAIELASGPVVMISNEIGLGVIPLGQEVRHYVDELGRLNQRLARICGQVTLMVSGIPMPLKTNL